ncbi:MAG TPA: protein phosphatase 2C domain-containing protein [Kofleriaceae bacterium]|nr:protein phosphatase 2C domain-containing protein [Kofleriaceae bacterium]
MAGRASIVGAAATHVGNVRDHNEDAHYFDADEGVFLVCDGMGGHAAGEVASSIAIRTIREQWAADDTQKLVDAWLNKGSPDTKKQLMLSLRDGALSAHHAILQAAKADDAKDGMGTTLVGAMAIGNELVFAQAGDSRAYLVRDGIAMQLTEDHTLLARLLAAGIDVDVSGEGARFRSMLTNALGIGQECKVSMFVVPLADGDRFLFCSDGISEYVPENEIGEVLTKQPSPARAAQKLIELALERGGNDNATAVVIRVLEAGETPQPAEQVRHDDDVIASCPLWGARMTLQQRLRALRIAIPREHASGTRLPAHALGDRVAWILVEGKLVHDDVELPPGALVYPESLIADSRPPERDRLAIARTDLRMLALRADDFRELCDDDSELAELLLEGLAAVISSKRLRRIEVDDDAEIEVSAGSEEDDQTEERPPASPPSAIDAAIDAIDALEIEERAASEPAPEPEPEHDLEPEIEVEDPGEGVHEELDARFDAVWAEGDAVPSAMKPTPSGRIPLILKPRASTDPAMRQSLRAQSPTVPGGPVVEAAAAAAKRPQTEPGSGPPAREPRRAPSEPEIEAVIELDAEAPDDEAADAGTDAQADDASRDSEPELELSLEADEPPDEAAPAAPIEDESSAPVLTMTVDDDDDESITADSLTDPGDDEEPTNVPHDENRRATRKLVVVSGRISTDPPDDRPRRPSQSNGQSNGANGASTSRRKRLSEGWDE